MPDPVLTPARYPNLQREGYTKESPDTPIYNCIAWAMGDTTRWWWPSGFAYWPPGCPLEETVSGFAEMLETFEYAECPAGDLEPGYEKVALYAINNVPTHAAHQEDDGKWTSKMGRYVDMRHTTIGLEGPRYGQVVKYFKRSQL